MPKPTDERLIAYLDGELDAAERDAITAQLERDPELRARVQGLGESAKLLRAAFDEVLREPLPERLIAAARGETAGKVASLASRLRRAMARQRHWWIGVPVAASLLGLLVGGGLGYFAGDEQGTSLAQEAQRDATGSWLDSLAGYHKLFVNAGADDAALADVPANGNDARRVVQKLPQDFRLPNLKPWGLQFQGARFLIVEGRPATQLFYTTTNKQLGPITLVVGQTQKPDIAPTFDHRDDLNLLYWRHHGRFYAIVGTCNIGYLWNIANDIAWQLDAI